MPICTRRGCGQDQSSSSPCRYHPGSPKFHEGLKSWSCCEQVNKPVMEFDQFMAIAGCEEAKEHSSERAVEEVKPASTAAAPSVSVKDGKEVYGTVASVTQTMSAATLSAKAAPVEEKKEEEADPDVDVAEGTACKRSGCGVKFEGGKRDRSKEECRHHGGVAVFHEGSKGYTCCKRRVLDFADFLQIEPCTVATKGHLFVGAPKEAKLECRLDWYETPADVRVTVYAKGVDEGRSGIEFKEQQVDLSLVMPAGKHERTLQTFAAIDTAASTSRISKMKVELVLVKAVKGQSWPVLESSEKVFGYGSTFGRA